MCGGPRILLHPGYHPHWRRKQYGIGIKALPSPILSALDLQACFLLSWQSLDRRSQKGKEEARILSSVKRAGAPHRKQVVSPRLEMKLWEEDQNCEWQEGLGEERERGIVSPLVCPLKQAS